MPNENLDQDRDDVAGHFQLPPETFDDEAPGRVTPPDGVRSRIGDDADDEDDDVAGHYRSYPKAVEDGPDESGEDVGGHDMSRI